MPLRTLASHGRASSGSHFAASGRLLLVRRQDGRRSSRGVSAHSISVRARDRTQLRRRLRACLRVVQLCKAQRRVRSYIGYLPVKFFDFLKNQYQERAKNDRNMKSRQVILYNLI